VTGPAVLAIETMSVSIGGADRRFCVEVAGFGVRAGECVCIQGPSGSGKTLFLETLALLRRPDAGTRASLDAGTGPRGYAELWSRSGMARLRAGAIGVIPQQAMLLPFLTVEGNIRIARELAGTGPSPVTGALMEALGLAPLAGLYPEALSIGQRQRVAVARALAHGPSLVIADEPTAALDHGLAGSVMDVLLAACRASGAAMVVSSHDAELVRSLDLPVYRFAAREGGAVTTSVLVGGRP